MILRHRVWFTIDCQTGTVTGQLRHTQYVLRAPDDPCVYCYGPANTVEHITPRSRGGFGENNTATACERCNCRRGSTPLLLWLLKVWRPHVHSS